MISMWDSYSGCVFECDNYVEIHCDVHCSIPVRSIFNGLGDGIIAAAMSSDARFIVLIGYSTPQVKCVCVCVCACACACVHCA